MNISKIQIQAYKIKIMPYYILYAEIFFTWFRILDNSILGILSYKAKQTRKRQREKNHHNLYVIFLHVKLSGTHWRLLKEQSVSISNRVFKFTTVIIILLSLLNNNNIIYLPILLYYTLTNTALCASNMCTPMRRSIAKLVGASIIKTRTKKKKKIK